MSVSRAGGSATKVSILLPTFNRDAYITHALLGAVGQSLRDLEILISDNASNDRTERVCREWVGRDRRIDYARNAENFGPVKNLRILLDRARGDFCCILSDDDYFIDPDYLRDAVDRLERNKCDLLICDVITGGRVKTCSNLGLNEVVPGLQFFRQYWVGPHYSPTISAVFRRAAALQCQPFMNATAPYCDLELWLKLALTSDIIYRDIPSVFYRMHAGSSVLDDAGWSLEKHKSNIRFIDDVARYASAIGSCVDIDRWYRRMYRRYLLVILANQCVRQGVPADEFAAFAVEVGRKAGVSWSECLRVYVTKQWRRRVKRVLLERAEKVRTT